MAIKIRGFSACVNYSDMLALIWPINKEFFDSYCIVTTPDDQRTIDFCIRNDIHHIESNSCYQNGAPFNKSAMLNKAIEYYESIYNSPDDWFVSLDCDIVVDGRKFPKDTIKLDDRFIFGCRRRIFDNKDDVAIPISLDQLTSSDKGYMQRLAPSYHHGMVGYFQMFGKKGLRFDESYITASHCDTKFYDDYYGHKWEFTFPTNILFSYHLGQIEQNWTGRKTERWIA